MASLPLVPLGASGFRVSRIGLGAMPLSLAGRPVAVEATGVLERAIELGVTLIDTADVYCLDDGEIGHNERLIGAALRARGVRFGRGADSEVVVASKGGKTRPGGRWQLNGHPDHLRQACDRSLVALGVEQIDLYQLHEPDAAVPLEDSIGALARLREAGKIGAVGLSNVTVDQIERARRLVPIATVQNDYGPWSVSIRPSSVIRYCAREGITFLAYAPLGGSTRVGALAASPALRALATRAGCTPAELTLAWILALGPHVVPIPGASRTSSVESAVRAASLTLDPPMRRAVRRAFGKLPGATRTTRRVVHKLRRMLGLSARES